MTGNAVEAILTVACYLRAAQMHAHNGHHLITGETFAEDHEWLGELYAAYEELYDDVIENVVGSGVVPNLVNVQRNAADLIDRKQLGRDAREYFLDLLEMEESIQKTIGFLSSNAKDLELKDGTVNLLQDLATKSQRRVFLLQGRTAKSATALKLFLGFGLAKAAMIKAAMISAPERQMQTMQSVPSPYTSVTQREFFDPAAMPNYTQANPAAAWGQQQVQRIARSPAPVIMPPPVSATTSTQSAPPAPPQAVPVAPQQQQPQAPAVPPQQPPPPIAVPQQVAPQVSTMQQAPSAPTTAVAPSAPAPQRTGHINWSDTPGQWEYNRASATSMPSPSRPVAAQHGGQTLNHFAPPPLPPVQGPPPPPPDTVENRLRNASQDDARRLGLAPDPSYNRLMQTNSTLQNALQAKTWGKEREEALNRARADHEAAFRSRLAEARMRKSAHSAQCDAAWLLVDLAQRKHYLSAVALSN